MASKKTEQGKAYFKRHPGYKSRRQNAKAKKYKVLKRDGNKCWLCHKNMRKDEMSVDHVIPIMNGGAAALTNLRLAHKECNEERGVKDVAEKNKREYAAMTYQAKMKEWARVARYVCKRIYRRVKYILK